MVLVDISVIKVYINKMTKEELKNLVLSNPRKCNYKFIKSNFPEIYNEIISIYFPDDFTFSQKLYHYMNDDLNYLEIYSTNLSECINVINTYINEHFNNE